MDPIGPESDCEYTQGGSKSVKSEKQTKKTLSITLSGEEDRVLSRLCALKKTRKASYFADLAKNQVKKELLNLAAEEYRKGTASLSALATKTGLDAPSIMEEVARMTGTDERAVEGFLSAVKAISDLNNDPEFYRLAVKAVKA